MRQAYYSGAFEEAPPEENGTTAVAPAPAEVNYEFQGFTIEVNEKVMLMAVQLTQPYG